MTSDQELERKMLANEPFTRAEFVHWMGRIADDFYANEGYGYCDAQGTATGSLTYTDLVDGFATYLKENCL